MAIDVHAHYFPPAYTDFVSTLANDSGPAAKAIHATLHHPFIGRDPVFQAPRIEASRR